MSIALWKLWVSCGTQAGFKQKWCANTCYRLQSTSPYARNHQKRAPDFWNPRVLVGMFPSLKPPAGLPNHKSRHHQGTQNLKEDGRYYSKLCREDTLTLAVVRPRQDHLSQKQYFPDTGHWSLFGEILETMLNYHRDPYIHP